LIGAVSLKGASTSKPKSYSKWLNFTFDSTSHALNLHKVTVPDSNYRDVSIIMYPTISPGKFFTATEFNFSSNMTSEDWTDVSDSEFEQVLEYINTSSALAFGLS
jgi:hypothetical protein